MQTVMLICLCLAASDISATCCIPLQVPISKALISADLKPIRLNSLLLPERVLAPLDLLLL